MSYIPPWLKPFLDPETIRDVVTIVRKALKGPAKLLAVGSTGTGKTTLVNALQDKMIPRMIDEVSRTNFAKSEKVKLPKGRLKITDTPGHRIDPDDVDSPRLNPQLEKAIEKGPYLGILNVVSYGYHQYLQDRPNLASRTALANYTREHRKHEIVGLKSWAPYLGKIGHDPFIITVVTKADLWLGTKGVLAYYESGDFYDELCAATGRPSVEHAVVRMSSRRQKFYGQIDPKEGWDDDDRAAARTNLIDQIFRAIAAQRD